MKAFFALALAISLASFAARADEAGDEPVSSGEENQLGGDVLAGPSKLCGKAGTCRKWNGTKCTNKSFFAVCSTLCLKKQPDFKASQCYLKAQRKFRLDQQGSFSGGIKPAAYLSEQVARGGIAARVGCKIVSVQKTTELYFGKVPPADQKSSLDRLRNVCLKGTALRQDRSGNVAGAQRTRGKLNNGRGSSRAGGAAASQGEGGGAAESEGQ